MKKVYITTGTYDFLNALKSKYKNEHLSLMFSTEHTLLLHETTGTSIFQIPRRYEVLDSYGNIPEKGFAVFNYVTVLEESKPVFEHQIKHRPKTILNTPGFIASRMLSPIKNDTYLLITFWDNEKAFRHISESNDTFIEIQKITSYPGPSFMKFYYLDDDED